MHSGNGSVECVVCRGSGNGKDGAYAGYNITKNHTNPDKTANPEEIAVEDDVDNNADCNIPRAVLVGDHCDDIDDSSVIFTIIADDTKCSEKVNTATIAVEEDYFFPNKKNNSMSCSVGEVVIPSLRHIFAGMSHLIKGDTGKKENQLKAKEKISQHVQMGWEVSSDQCASCDMPLFSKAEGMHTNKLCVLCGPISGSNFANPASSQHIHHSMNGDFQERASNEMARLMLAGWTVSNNHVCEQCVLPLLSNPASDLLHCVGCVIRSTHKSSANPSMMNFGTRDILDLDNKAQEMISRKMVNQVMAGWTIVEGKQCQSCSMPVMRDPQTHLAHCVACGGHADNFGTSFQPMHHHQAMHHHHQAFGSPFPGAGMGAGNYRMRVVPMIPQPYAGNHHSMSSSKMRVMQGNLSTLVRAETPLYYQEAKGRDPTPSNFVAPTVEAFHMYDPPTGRTPSNMANNRRHFE